MLNVEEETQEEIIDNSEEQNEVIENNETDEVNEILEEINLNLFFVFMFFTSFYNLNFFYFF